MGDERNLTEAIAALGATIRELRLDLMLRGNDIDRLKEENNKLRLENAELLKLAAERRLANDTD